MAMNSIKWTAARVEARLLVWDAIQVTADYDKRQLLIRVYNHMAKKGWAYAEC